MKYYIKNNKLYTLHGNILIEHESYIEATTYYPQSLRIVDLDKKPILNTKIPLKAKEYGYGKYDFDI